MFLRGEKEVDYNWGMKTLRTWYDEEEIPIPEVITTDRELALTNAVHIWLPETTQLLCRWHINKNVVKRAKPLYPKDPENMTQPGPEFKQFYAAYTAVMQASTEAEYVQQLTDFRASQREDLV